MKYQNKLLTATVTIYIVAAVLFTFFFTYVGRFERASVETTREQRGYSVVTEYEERELPDSSAPIGIRREFSWIIPDVEGDEVTLAFYLVHHYVQVYIDDQPVYSLLPDDSNRIGKSVSSNWVTIPIYEEDAGKEIRVVATPVYEQVRNRRIEFKLGSLHKIYRDQLANDIVPLIISVACISMGVIIMVAQLLLNLLRNLHKWELFWLGNFTFLLGLWKLSDTRFSPFIFPKETMLLGYVAIGVLFLTPIPFALYMKEQFSERRTRRILLAIALAESVVAIGALVCQIMNIADFRQTLTWAHVSILTLVIVLFPLLIQHLRNGKNHTRLYLPLLLLISGVVGDVITYYVRGNSSGIVLSLLTFLVCTVSVFISSLLNIGKQAYTDSHTGLANRSRWNMLMETDRPMDELTTIMIADINQLKYINDTMGHEAGDKAIFTFANILRNILPPTATICRWGGDEFSVMLAGADRPTVELYLQRIDNAVNDYNLSDRKPELHYAIGYAMSSDFPDLSFEELLEKADEQMYQNKQLWYQKKGRYS